MKNDLTPLKALEELRFQVGNIRAGTHDNPPQLSPYLVRDMGLFEIIETALKEYEEIKKCYENELKNVSYYNNLALKYKKALEIIKKLPEGEKQILLNVIYTYRNSEEEYDLFKEILWTD